MRRWARRAVSAVVILLNSPVRPLLVVTAGEVADADEESARPDDAAGDGRHGAEETGAAQELDG